MKQAIWLSCFHHNPADLPASTLFSKNMVQISEFFLPILVTWPDPRIVNFPHRSVQNCEKLTPYNIIKLEHIQWRAIANPQFLEDI